MNRAPRLMRFPAGTVGRRGRAARTNVGTGRFQIEYRGIESLILDPRNPRQHPQKQVLQIADSIREFGFIMPAVIDDKGQVIIGHGRVLAAKQLRMFEVPVIEVKHLSSTHKLALNAHWDERLLGEEFVALQELDLDFEIEITGFSAPEIDLTIQNLGREGTQDPEEQGSITGAAVCQSSDLWLLDGHRLLCGDATSEVAFEQLMGTQRARLIFTAPPYNVRIEGHVSGNGRIKHREFAQASGEMTSAEFTRFLVNSCGLLADFSADGSIHFVCMDWRHAEELLAAGKQVYSDLKNINVWAKNNAGMGSLYRSQHEFIFVFKSGAARHVNNIELGKNGRHRSNVWNYAGASTEGRRGNNLLALHPTAKPVTMVMDAILDCSNRGDIVLDSFLGSGTTLLAAERTGRLCCGLELDPFYVDTTIRRWQNLTGRDARRASDNKTFREIEAEQEEQDEK